MKRHLHDERYKAEPQSPQSSQVNMRVPVPEPKLKLLPMLENMKMKSYFLITELEPLLKSY